MGTHVVTPTDRTKEITHNLLRWVALSLVDASQPILSVFGLVECSAILRLSILRLWLDSGLSRSNNDVNRDISRNTLSQIE